MCRSSVCDSLFGTAFLVPCECRVLGRIGIKDHGFRGVVGIQSNGLGSEKVVVVIIAT